MIEDYFSLTELKLLNLGLRQILNLINEQNIEVTTLINKVESFITEIRDNEQGE